MSPSIVNSATALPPALAASARFPSGVIATAETESAAVPRLDGSSHTAPECRCRLQVRTRLAAGGKEIRTVGPAVKEKPFRRAIWLLFARTYRTSGLAETGTSRIKKFTFGTAETCGVDRREGQARIVDKDVDAAEPRHRHRDDAVTIRRLAQIRDKRQDLPGNVTLSRCSIDFGDIRVDMANCNDVISLAREPEALKVLAGYS